MPLTSDRNTWRRDVPRTMHLGVAANTIIYQGALVSRNAAGWAVPASDTPGETALGRAEEQVDNRGKPDGEQVIVVARGVFRWDNNPANAITQADFGVEAYVADDYIVSRQPANGIGVVAGIIEGIEDAGIWVATV